MNTNYNINNNYIKKIQNSNKINLFSYISNTKKLKDYKILSNESLNLNKTDNLNTKNKQYKNEYLDKNFKELEKSINQKNGIYPFNTKENNEKIVKYPVENSNIKSSDLKNENSLNKLVYNNISDVLKNDNVSINNIFTETKNNEKISLNSNSKYLNHNNNSFDKKNSNYVDEIFSNLRYNTENNIKEFQINKINTISLTNNKLNCSIKSLSNNSCNSKDNMFEDHLNSQILTYTYNSKNKNLYIKDNNCLENNPSMKIYNEIEDKYRILDPFNKVPVNERISKKSPNKINDSYSMKIQKINKDSSFSSTNKSSNNKMLRLSVNSQVNPLDTDINIIENNRDKDREKDKLAINEMLNNKNEDENNKIYNAFSADNHFTKLSDRTYDKNYNRKNCLVRENLKNIEYKTLLNNRQNKNIKSKVSNIKDIKFSNLFLNLKYIKNNIAPFYNMKINTYLKMNNQINYKKENNLKKFNNKKIPFIQVKKNINNYLNEKNANKQLIFNNINEQNNYIENKIDSFRIINKENSAKILNTDPNENIEKTKINLMKNLNLDIDLNKNIDLHTMGKNISNLKNYIKDDRILNTMNNHICETTQKTIFSDIQLYEFEDNYELNNLTSERIFHNKNINDLENFETIFNNNLDRGLFIKENLKARNLKDKTNLKLSPNIKDSDKISNVDQNNVLYSSVIEFINKNLNPFEIEEIINKIRIDSIFYLGDMNARFQIFYSKLDLIKNFIEIALKRNELNITLSSNRNQINKDFQKSESCRTKKTTSSDSKNSEYLSYNNNFDKKIDDENGNYIVRIGDHIDYRYEIISELGSGSFGQALKCFDHRNKEFVCVKIIKNKKKFIKQSKIEINLLEFIKRRDVNDEKNIVRILENFSFRNHNVNNYFIFCKK